MQKVEVLPELYYSMDSGLCYVISKSGVAYCVGYSKIWYSSERNPEYIKLKDEVLSYIKMRWIHVGQ